MGRARPPAQLRTPRRYILWATPAPPLTSFMHALTRTVRFAINPRDLRDESSARDPNGFAGAPSFRGLARHYELQVRCQGPANPVTGYLVDIKDVDRAVRTCAIPAIQAACDSADSADPGSTLTRFLPTLRDSLDGTLRSVRWLLTPFHSVEAHVNDPTTVLIRQRFDFCASHRLNIPSLSGEENRRLFGKCNNPTGHGHNYQFEPCIAVPAGGAPPRFSLQSLESLAESSIIARFDHKNLNSDTAEFRDGSGLNPTVENIARVCFDLLAPEVARAGASLHSVTVWETDRTSCTYPAT